MRPTARSFRLLAILLPLCFAAVSASEYHKYQLGDPVTLWVNKVGPYDNPQETYNYYSLPFCQQAGIAAQRWGGLGEVLGGNELIDSQIEIKFRRNVDKGSVCALELDDGKVKQFQDAIKNFYWQELFIDDLPLWGFVGEVRSHKNNENKYYLFTHKDIVVNYNGDQIIYVNFTPDGAKLLEVGRTLDMTYSVKWVKTNITFAKRFDVYLDYPFFEHQIHWFSIFNSFMMVLFLTGLVSMILMRTLRNDYAKYAREDDDLETTLERDASEESGWKLIHGDVFRPPPNLALLSAVVGTGAQLTMLVLLVILLAIIGMLYVGRGAIITAFIVCYALTSFISGNELDQVDGPDGVALPLRVLRDRIRPEHHRHLLRLARRHPLRHDGGGARHLGLRLVPAGPARHRGGPKLERRPQQPLPREDDPPAHSPEEMVPHPAGDLPHGRPPPLRQHLHRDVLRLLLLLELQGVLRLRLHAAGVPDPRHRHHLCDHRGHLLPAERRELQLAVDLLLLRRLHGCLRLPLLHLLLPREDQDVRPLPDQLLLRLHPDALPRPGHPLRCCGLSGFFPVRQENLQEHQMRLGVDHRRISLSLSPSLPRSSKNPVDLGKNRIYIYQSIYLSAVVSADGLHPVPERQFSLLTYQRPHKNRVLNPETFRQRVSLSLSLTGVGG